MILETIDIGKTYRSGDQDIRVLDGVSLSVNRGEFVSIQGESGSGKTTFLNIVAGLERADSGMVMWNGTSIGDSSTNELSRLRRSFVSMVFQSYYLVPEVTAIDNVILAARIAGGGSARSYRSQAQALLERVGIGDRPKQMPGTLSGGERQRVAIARALIAKPAVILADEPTGNLDEGTGDGVMDLLGTLCLESQTALILVTHNKKHAALADRQIHLVNGVMNLGDAV